ncbi:hypothetical protein BD410DRAFT_527663 [Rickenella mellea]|uniref:Uncharacterized protein n=1 Tax=Rickenella mellea TaxID=50990 RepID=A0A4Y7QI89_9AGAM|nr:hypothetical protein BD410DRAFT_527663 [Rickenella mellea]
MFSHFLFFISCHAPHSHVACRRRWPNMRLRGRIVNPHFQSDPAWSLPSTTIGNRYMPLFRPVYFWTGGLSSTH